MANILIVDDSATDQKELKKVLEKNGHSVAVTDNGDDGVKLSKSEQPDLILMDVVMQEKILMTTTTPWQM